MNTLYGCINIFEMIRSTPISAHISRVHEELEKLANIIKQDKKMFENTKQALL